MTVGFVRGETFKPLLPKIQGGSNMTGTYAACLHRNQSRSYLNHLVYFTINNREFEVTYPSELTAKLSWESLHLDWIKIYSSNLQNKTVGY